MKMNRYLFQFGVCISIIFGGLCSLQYSLEGQLQQEELYTCIMGICLAVDALLWRKFMFVQQKKPHVKAKK